MNVCYDTNKDFDFTSLCLGTPQSLPGGAYFSKVRVGNEPHLLFQAPKCTTKCGIVRTGKKTYCDLSFTNDDENFLQWYETLERTFQNLIFEKRETWFHNQMELEDIEDLYIHGMKVYQGDKYLIRSFVNKPRHIKRSISLQIFDENECELSVDDITKDKKIICILEVLGIKFTSSSFRTELCLRQIMVMDDKPLFAKCLIHHGSLNRQKSNEAVADILTINTENNETINTSSDNKTDKVTNVEEETIDEQQEENDMITVKGGAVPREPSTVTEKEKDDISPNLAKETTEVVNQITDEEKKRIQEKVKQETSQCIDEIIKERSPVEAKHLDKNRLQEVNLAISDKDTMKLKKPNEVYYEIYAEARRKAKIAKQKAIEAYLEAKRIKNTYLLNGVDSSDDSDNDSLSELNDV